MLVRKESKKAQVKEQWSTYLDGSSRDKDDLLGWLKHERWDAFQNSLTGTDGMLHELSHIDRGAYR